MQLEDAQISRLTSKGQVLLHKAVRERVGLRPGASVRVGVNADGQAVVVPVETAVEGGAGRQRRLRRALDNIVGWERDGRPTDEQMRELRGEREL